MQSNSRLEAELPAVLERLLPLMRGLSAAGALSASAASLIAWLAREGPQRLTDLAAHQHMSQPGMTQLVTRLEREGLVRRVPGTGDRRVVAVAATGIARELAERRRAERAVAMRGLLARLDSADQAAIRAALPALARLASLEPVTFSADQPAARTSGDKA